MQRCAGGVVQDREDHVEVDVQRNPAGERAEAEGSDGSSEALLDVHPHRVGLDDLPLPWSRLWFCWRPGARRCGEINWHGTRWVAFSPPKPKPGRVTPCSACLRHRQSGPGHSHRLGGSFARLPPAPTTLCYLRLSAATAMGLLSVASVAGRPNPGRAALNELSAPVPRSTTYLIAADARVLDAVGNA